MTAFALSVVRTVVPVIVGTLLSWFALAGLEIDQAGQDGLSVFLTGTFIAIYYLLVRLIGQKFPGVEILLGSAKSPDNYSKGTLETPQTMNHVSTHRTEPTLPWENDNHPSVPQGYDRE